MLVEILLMYLKVFFVGGAICTIAQLLINLTKLTFSSYYILYS